jgi:hypothetical protein
MAAFGVVDLVIPSNLFDIGCVYEASSIDLNIVHISFHRFFVAMIALEHRRS